MIVGHTKFSPDSSFGRFKQKFQKTSVECLKDIGEVVRKSSSSNSFEMVGWENGVPLIPTYDWNSFFAPEMKKLKGIKKFQHFTFAHTEKGKITCAAESDSQTTTIDIIKTNSWCPSSILLPEIIPPKGLDLKRQWYLYEKIRPFCLTPQNKDIVCPLPLSPKPVNSAPGTPEPSPCLSGLDYTPEPPPPPKKRKCGKCDSAGHNSRTCTHFDQ